MKVKLSRAQFRGKVGPGQIDVTARTGRPEAPEWAWVKAYKAGQMSEEEYTQLYHAKLERAPLDHWRELWRWGREHGGQVTFLCYCRDGEFCHTVLLGDRLVERFPTGFAQ